MCFCDLSCKILQPASGEGERKRERSPYSEMIVLNTSALDKSQLSNNFKYIENSEQSVKQSSQKDYSL